MCEALREYFLSNVSALSLKCTLRMLGYSFIDKISDEMKVVCGHLFVGFVLHPSKEMKHVLGKGEKKRKPEQPSSHGFTHYGRIGEQLVVTLC